MFGWRRRRVQQAADQPELKPERTMGQAVQLEKRAGGASSIRPQASTASMPTCTTGSVLSGPMLSSMLALRHNSSMLHACNRELAARSLVARSARGLRVDG
jgi:hypothetical protein